jgi:hypothetical protein
VPVEIAIAAPTPDAAAAVRADLRELLARLGVSARYRDVAKVDRDEVLRPPAESPCSLACLWLDLGVGAPGRAVVYVSATTAEQVVIRRLPLAAGWDEVAREEVSHVVASSVEALRAGRPLPVASGPDTSVVAVAASPPPPPPPPDGRVARLGLGLGAASESADQTAWPTASLSLIVGDAGRAPALWVQLDGAASDRAGAPVGLRFRGGDLAALAALSTRSTSLVVARLGVGLGAELVDVTPVLGDSTTPGVTLGGSTLQPSAFARVAARVEVRALDHLGVFLAAACDARFVTHRYTLDRAGAPEAMFESRRLRPWVVLGVDAVLGGAP